MITAATSPAGAGCAGLGFRLLTGLAHSTVWLNPAMEFWTNAGLGVFALLATLAWWCSRRRGPRAVALAAGVPAAVGAAFLLTELIKDAVAEPRPCRALAHSYIVETCPAAHDYAFPSGHVTVAAATAAALALVHRPLAAIAAGFAVFEAFTRVYLGAHYPYDVLGAAVIAAPVALVVCWIFGRATTPVAMRASIGILRVLITAPSTRRASDPPTDRLE